MRLYILTVLLASLISCAGPPPTQTIHTASDTALAKTSLVVLGNVQDAGSPQIACTKDCCKDLFKSLDQNRKVVALGVMDPQNKAKFLFEATPDIATQLKALKKYSPFSLSEVPDGIFLTHAHIGHYTGLMYLGKEALGAKSIPVFAMPAMKHFLESNGPWSQLVSGNNIALQALQHNNPVSLTSNLQVVPFKVPHRDEYSETVGYRITGPNKKALFIPDIDKWEKWDLDIIGEIGQVDYAFIDATFFDAEEINNRNIAEIPHPFIIESMAKFKYLPASEKSKVYFIHMNHTNPALNPTSSQTKAILKSGFNIARMHDIFEL